MLCVVHSFLRNVHFLNRFTRTFSRSRYLRSTSSRREMPLTIDERNLVWIDMEMTGLNLSKDRIIEVACLITGPDLKEIVEGPNVTLHCSDDILHSMDEWCQKTHGNSGLIEEVRRSKLTITQVEQQLLDFVSKYAPPGKCPLAGSSVHCDRAFLTVYMPRLVDYLHYRIVDVSSIKELVRRWYPEVKLPPKAEAHRALADIRESIAELRWYRENVFRT